MGRVPEASVAAMTGASYTPCHDSIELAGVDLPADILAELEEGVRDDVVEALDDRFLAEVVCDLDTDDAVYLLEDLEEERKQDVLDATLDGLMNKDFRSFNVTQAQEEVAYGFNQYHLVSAPVVDETGRLSGVITIDDAMQVLDEEAEEDLMRLGGVGDEELSDTVLETTKQRLPWLAVNLITAILASIIISQFDMVIEKIVALAVLMTIVASMGGNVGTQTLTVAVRALATKDLTATNAVRIISREGLVGFLNGGIFAVVMGAAAWWWYGDPTLGIVLGVAMIVNMVVAALAGILIPLGLEKVGADPALASAVFVTTVTDVVGFFAFLGLAAVVLL